MPICCTTCGRIPLRHGSFARASTPLRCRSFRSPHGAKRNAGKARLIQTTSSRAHPPRPGQHPDRAHRRPHRNGHVPPAASARGRRPGRSTTNAFGERRHPRRGLAAAEMAALGLGAEPELDRGGRSPPPSDDAGRRDARAHTARATRARSGTARTRSTPRRSPPRSWPERCRAASPVRWRRDRARPRRRSRARRARRRAGRLPITSTGTSSTSALVPSPKLFHSRKARRQQIEELHQRLRHQPRDRAAAAPIPCAAAPRRGRGRRGIRAGALLACAAPNATLCAATACSPKRPEKDRDRRDQQRRPEARRATTSGKRRRPASRAPATTARLSALGRRRERRSSERRIRRAHDSVP